MLQILLSWQPRIYSSRLNFIVIGNLFKGLGNGVSFICQQCCKSLLHAAVKKVVKGPSCWEGETPFWVPFSTTLDFNVLGLFYLEGYRCPTTSVQMFPSSDWYPCCCQAFQLGIALFRANYCWKCSLDIFIKPLLAQQCSNTLSSHRDSAILRKPSVRWPNRIKLTASPLLIKSRALLKSWQCITLFTI